MELLSTLAAIVGITKMPFGSNDGPVPMLVPIDTIRNIGIVAHIDAGKTTTTERILYYAGTSHRMGNVDDGTTVTDFDPDEARRGITIYSAAITCHWNGFTINIIDTPGHVDFTAEVERSLRVLDGATVIFSAVEGIEAQSETVWRQADRYHVPRICFINKMDRLGANFFRTFDGITERLDGRPVALQIPIGAGSPPDPQAFEGLIDLIRMKALYFDSASQGADIRECDIPESYQEAAQQWRQKLLETVALMDDEMFNLYMETGDVPIDQIHRLLRTATIHGQVQPVLCGASLDHIGVQPFMDAIVAYLPSPLDRPPIEGLHPNPKKQGKENEIRRPLADEPFCGLCFKIQVDQHANLCFIRVYSGRLKAGSRVLNPRLGQKELISQIWRIQADSREPIEAKEVCAGDIVGVIGPKVSATGDTLCDPQRPIILESIQFPETVISMAVEPETNTERKKLADVLSRLSRQDPTFTAKVSEDTGQTIISGMGELHLEVIRDRMERDFKLKVRVHKPQVTYRETVRTHVETHGEFHRKTGDSAQFAAVTLRIEPFPSEDAITLDECLKPGTLPNSLVTVLKNAVLDRASGGGMVGYPLMDVRFTLLDAAYREGETTDVAVQAAAQDAVDRALIQAGIVLLEPIMRLGVVTPDAFRGNIQADLNTRRAIVLSSERQGPHSVIEAEVPLSQMFGYSTQIRNLSQGRASYSMEPSKYAEAPAEVLQAMLG